MDGSNSSVTLAASAARTADLFVEHSNLHWAGIILIVDVTAVTATPVVTPRVQVKDESGLYDNVIWSAAANITATGQFRYIIYPGATGGDVTEVVPIVLPQEWRLRMQHLDADSITYSIRGHYIV